jgi:carboxymethylenebutenolidase
MTITNATVQISVADGTTMPAYLARPAGGQAPTGVIVAHELFAVNPGIRTVADDLAAVQFSRL